MVDSRAGVCLCISSGRCESARDDVSHQRRTSSLRSFGSKPSICSSNCGAMQTCRTQTSLSAFIPLSSLFIMQITTSVDAFEEKACQNIPIGTHHMTAPPVDGGASHTASLLLYTHMEMAPAWVWGVRGWVGPLATPQNTKNGHQVVTVSDSSVTDGHLAIGAWWRRDVTRI